MKKIDQKAYISNTELLKNNTSKVFTIHDKKYFMIKKDDNIYMYENNCPHLNITLDWGNDVFLDNENNLIQCATHGALFLIENGMCVSGPCLEQKLKAVDFIIEEKDIFVILNKL